MYLQTTKEHSSLQQKENKKNITTTLQQNMLHIITAMSLKKALYM